MLYLVIAHTITPKTLKMSVKSNGFWPDIAIMAGFLDLTRLLGRVMGSDLVLSVCNTCADQYTVLWITSRYNVTPKMLRTSVKVTDSARNGHSGGFS